MQLPFFYQELIDSSTGAVQLDEDTSRHVVQVLRMKEGDRINLTDGLGNLYTADILSAHKKHCNVTIIAKESAQKPSHSSIISISLLKNSGRFEWFLEKATELGISGIIPLICERTEKEKFRMDRMKSILISALIQSRQSWLPVLHDPVPYDALFDMEEVRNADAKFIAHCMEGDKSHLRNVVSQFTNRILLIGPEGDFTKEEVDLALKNKFTAVSLGNTRLRTETAALAGVVMLR